MFKYFSQFLKENGGTMLGSFGVGADQQDFNAELTKIKELNPEIIYFGGLTPIGIRVLKQMEKLGITAQFQGTSGIVGEAFVNGAGTLAEGTVAMYDNPPVEKNCPAVNSSSKKNTPSKSTTSRLKRMVRMPTRPPRW
ncbi:ABC transporter substrate-binding protein [Undibacterium arcticum]